MAQTNYTNPQIHVFSSNTVSLLLERERRKLRCPWNRRQFSAELWWAHPYHLWLLTTLIAQMKVRLGNTEWFPSVRSSCFQNHLVLRMFCNCLFLFWIWPPNPVLEEDFCQLRSEIGLPRSFIVLHCSGQSGRPPGKGLCSSQLIYLSFNFDAGYIELCAFCCLSVSIISTDLCSHSQGRLQTLAIEVVYVLFRLSVVQNRHGTDVHHFKRNWNRVVCTNTKITEDKNVGVMKPKQVSLENPPKLTSVLSCVPRQW